MLHDSMQCPKICLADEPVIQCGFVPPLTCSHSLGRQARDLRVEPPLAGNEFMVNTSVTLNRLLTFLLRWWQFMGSS